MPCDTEKKATMLSDEQCVKSDNDQVPVVQSVVSLTSSLRVISLTVLADQYTIYWYFWLKKCE